jgi:multidrug resistance efflux pump
MELALLMMFGFLVVVWLVFFKFKWLKFNIAWGIVSAFFELHILLIFLIGLRFMTPYSTNAKVIQHTIQLIPRLPEPTLVTAVLVEPDVPVKKGQPLFQFDRRPYEYKVRQIEAHLAAAKQNVRVLKADMEVAGQKVSQQDARVAEAQQNVRVLKADVEVAAQKVVKTESELVYARYSQQLAQGLASKGAGPEEEAQKSTAQLHMAEAAVKEAQAELERARLKYESEIGGVNTTVAALEATVKEAQAELERARLKYESEIGGVNTTVAALEAELSQARYYLDNTTLVAPEDGRIVNLQVRPGMVSGIFRAGGIAAFIVEADRYVLASFFREHLKYVKSGQPVEVALDLYPGQVFPGRVDSIWRASGDGQMLPTDIIPTFLPQNPNTPQGQYAVKVRLDGVDQTKFPIGAQGAAAIYTNEGAWAVLRRISIRIHTWFNWLYPMPF